MLIIGQPKSCTSSLMATIAKEQKIKYIGVIQRLDYERYPIEYDAIAEHHSNMTDRGARLLYEMITNKNIIYREHLIPSKEHQESIDRIKKNIVLLLRQPKYSMDSYNRLLDEHNNTKTDRELMYKHLKEWHKKWVKWAIDKPFVLVIWYDDLIGNYKETMDKIYKHYGLKTKPKYQELEKLRYTGVGVNRLKEKAMKEKK